jgi:hypothetical protein
MLAQIATKTLSAVAGAALLAGLAVALPSGAPVASAEPQVETATQQPAAKGDRLATRVTGLACSEGAWPYDQNCQFDHRQAADEARTVRIIALR